MIMPYGNKKKEGKSHHPDAAATEEEEIVVIVLRYIPHTTPERRFIPIHYTHTHILFQ